MKSVLLNANADPGWESRFQVALDVARAFDSHLSCLQVLPYELYVAIDAFGPAYASTDLYDSVHEAARQHQGEVEARLRRENVAWDWFWCDAEPARIIIRRSGLSDLIVISNATNGRENGDLGPAGTICTRARGPILAVPLQLSAFDPLGTAVIAWNGSLECAHTVRLGLPLLAKADAVHLLTVTEDATEFPATELCEYLARHGVACELHVKSPKQRALAETLVEPSSVADVILGTARSLSADYIVAGAYGHSRFREAVFGGVTRDLLRNSEVPLLLAH